MHKPSTINRLLRRSSALTTLWCILAAVSRTGGYARGQGLVEYGLILAIVAVLSIASLLIFKPALPGLLSRLAGSV